MAFKVHLGSQASSLVEAKNSPLLLSYNGYLLDPIEWLKGTQASCVVLRIDCSLGPAGKEGSHLEMTGYLVVFLELGCDVWGFSRVIMGNSGRLYCGPLGSPVSFRVVRWGAALLLSHGKGIRPQDTLKGKS